MPEKRVRIKVYGKNPWDHTVPDEKLMTALWEVAEERSRDIQNRHANGEYKRNSISFSVLDPTAPKWKPSDETLLATVTIGLEGVNYEINALVKAITQRDYGMDCGILAHTQKHRLPDGAFKWGYSVEVDGTVVGASGLAETQDKHQAYMFATSFNNKIVDLHKAWEEAHPGSNWWCNLNQPLPRYTEILNQETRLSL